MKAQSVSPKDIFFQHIINCGSSELITEAGRIKVISVDEPHVYFSISSLTADKTVNRWAHKDIIKLWRATEGEALSSDPNNYLEDFQH